MSESEGFGSTRDVEITVLVDNRSDLLLKSTETVKRFTDEPLLAEHGFAALVHLKAEGIRILWDAGMTHIALMENLRRMELDITEISTIGLSHGHGDHYTALPDVLSEISNRPSQREWPADTTAKEIDDWLARDRIPVVAHPAAFRERWGIGRDGKKYGPSVVPRAQWEANGAAIVLSEGPFQFAPGCWTTGSVPRRSFETAGTPSRLAYREGEEFIRDYLDDDQSVVINVADKGLVVLTGCAHAGIVNTVVHAQEISGEERVWAILGGFHLAQAKEEEIERTIDAIEALQPQLVAPTHCSGFHAMARFEARMPEAFVVGAVGTSYLF